MSACFQQSGILPSENDKLKILQIDIANDPRNFLVSMDEFHPAQEICAVSALSVTW